MAPPRRGTIDHGAVRSWCTETRTAVELGHVSARQHLGRRTPGHDAALCSSASRSLYMPPASGRASPRSQSARGRSEAARRARAPLLVADVEGTRPVRRAAATGASVAMRASDHEALALATAESREPAVAEASRSRRSSTAAAIALSCLVSEPKYPRSAPGGQDYSNPRHIVGHQRLCGNRRRARRGRERDRNASEVPSTASAVEPHEPTIARSSDDFPAPLGRSAEPLPRAHRSVKPWTTPAARTSHSRRAARWSSLLLSTHRPTRPGPLDTRRSNEPFAARGEQRPATSNSLRSFIVRSAS